MDDKKILERPDQYKRTGGFRISLNGEWREYSAKALDAGEAIYEAYVMWDLQGIPDEADIVSVRAIELDKLHTKISDELNDSVWSGDFSKRNFSVAEYVMLTEVNDMIYAVLRSSMVNHSSDELGEAVCGEDR